MNILQVSRMKAAIKVKTLLLLIRPVANLKVMPIQLHPLIDLRRQPVLIFRGNGEIIFQHDGTPPHSTAEITQFLNNAFPNRSLWSLQMARS